MKDLENHHIGKRDDKDPGSYDYHNEAADALSMFGCLGTCIMIIIVFLLGLCSCTPKTVTIREEVPIILHDTVNNTVVRIDSFVTRDSVFFETYIKGDTMYVNKYVEKWRTKREVVHDTAFQIIEVPVETVECTEVPVEVPRKHTKWERIVEVAGYIFLISAFTYLLLIILTRVRARKDT